MNADNEPLKYKELTDLIIKAFYKVYSTLGYGFLEKVYLNALIIELAKLNVSAVPQCLLQVNQYPAAS
jgi:GxxExxY protein